MRPFDHLDADALERVTRQIEIEARHARASDPALRARIAADYRSLLDEHAARAVAKAQVSRGTLTLEPNR